MRPRAQSPDGRPANRRTYHCRRLPLLFSSFLISLSIPRDNPSLQPAPRRWAPPGSAFPFRGTNDSPRLSGDLISTPTCAQTAPLPRSPAAPHHFSGSCGLALPTGVVRSVTRPLPAHGPPPCRARGWGRPRSTLGLRWGCMLRRECTPHSWLFRSAGSPQIVRLTKISEEIWGFQHDRQGAFRLHAPRAIGSYTRSYCSHFI